MTWPTVKLGEVCVVKRGTTITEKNASSGMFPVVAGGMTYSYTHNIANRKGNVITISGSGANAGYVNYWGEPIFASDCSTVEVDNNNIDIKYVYFFLKKMQIFINSTMRSGAAQPHVYAKDIALMEMPLPPLAAQQRIAAILDKAEEIKRKREQAIEKLNQLAQSTFEEMFVINASAKDATRPVKEICEFKYGKSLPSSQREPGPFRVYGSNGVVGMHSAPITDGETIIIGRKGSYGEINYSEDSCYPIDTTFYVDRTATSHNLTWLIYALSQLKLNTMNKSAAVPGLSRDDAYRQVVRVPNLTRQRAFEDKVKAIELLKSLAKAHVEQFKKASASLQHQAFSTGFDA